VSIYLSTDGIIDTTDRALTTFLAEAPAGTEQSYTKNVALPVVLVPGSYYLGTIVDTGNRVGETNESNNSGVGNQIYIASDIDLVTISVSGPSSGSPGQQISITVGIKNQGSIGAGESYVTAYFSIDSTIAMDDTQLGSVYVNNLGAGAQQTVTLNTTIPTSLNGSYYIGAIADGRSDVSESNENNNSLAGNQISVASTLPDIILLSVSGPSSASLGKSIPITVVVKNQGAASSGGFYVSGYLSSDPTITTNDSKIGTTYLNGLAANAEQTVTINGKVPSKFSLGSYYVGAVADIENRVAESNESNNARVGNQISIKKR
jgi:subtilase family serine protease